MDFMAVIDVSSIIWDETDYQSNTNQFYELANSVSTLFMKLEEEKPKILLRKKLQEQMINAFPFGKIPYSFSEFERIAYTFLTKTGSNIFTYSYSNIIDILSFPDLIKEHYNDTTKEEIRILISKIHLDSDTKNVYFTFQYLWERDAVLKTKKGEEEKVEHETIISDREKELDEFFQKFKRIFEHNPKHNKTKLNTKKMWVRAKDKSLFISRLSCYDGDDTIPQELLDSGRASGDCYYNYDLENEVYVVFRCHLNNKYHGYDENSNDDIPNEIKKHFNK